MKGSTFANAIKLSSGKPVNELGLYCKWSAMHNDEQGLWKRQMKAAVMQGELDGEKAYWLVIDRMVACAVTRDLNEINEWLAAHGWKTEHKWYIEDNGMTEETWQMWNNGEE